MILHPAHRTWSIVALLAFVATLLTDPVAFGALVNRKLNDPLADGAEIVEFQISPDGLWVVYYLFKLENSLPGFDLYSVPIEGGSPVKLNTEIPPGSSVRQAQILPDSRHVLFIGPLDTTGFDELYRVPIAGPAYQRIKLSVPLATGGMVYWAEVSPDGSRVVYVVRRQTDAPDELYSVPVGGPAGDGVKINGDLVEGGSASAFHISPDGQRVVYRADMQVDDSLELYSVPIEGPGDAWVKLSGPLPSGSYVDLFRITPDSSRVVYQRTNYLEYFSVPIEGPAALGQRISAPQPGGVSDHGEFQVSADSSRLLYMLAATGSPMELYSTPIAGPSSEAKTINHTLPGPNQVTGFKISPNSQWAVYGVGASSGVDRELYTVPVEGPSSASIRVSRPAIGGETVSWPAEISPDSSWVVFTGKQLSTKEELYSVSARGLDLTQINGSLRSVERVTSGILRISPDGRRVAYRANSISLFLRTTRLHLYAVPIRGPRSAAVVMSGPMVNGGEVLNFKWAPDSNHIVYQADQTTDGTFELYVTFDRPAAAWAWQGYH